MAGPSADVRATFCRWRWIPFLLAPDLDVTVEEENHACLFMHCSIGPYHEQNILRSLQESFSQDRPVRVLLISWKIQISYMD